MFNENKIQNKIMLLTAVIVLSAVFMTGCDLSSLSFNNTTKGALTIAVNSSRFVSSRSVEPSTDMTPAEYKITGIGPDSATFERTLTGTTVNVYDLSEGNWTVTILAYNASGEQIGWGESAVTVTASMLTDVSILVEPYSGNGSIQFLINWNNDDVAAPAVDAVLTNAAGTETTLPFDVGSGTATYSDSAVSAGYYTLNIKLYDGDTKVSGLAESVRVLEDFQTTGEFNFTDLNNPTGDVSISVVVNMYEPFEPVINGASDTLSYGSDMSVTSTVPDSDGETLIYKWYVNGDLVGSADSLTFGNDLSVGYYRLDLVVTNEDGSRSGSAAHYFTVE